MRQAYIQFIGLFVGLMFVLNGILAVNTMNMGETVVFSFNFDFAKPKIGKVNIGEKSYNTVDIAGLSKAGNPGTPYLPTKSIRVLLPPGGIVKNIRVVTSDAIYLGDGYLLEPAPEPIPIGYQGPPKPIADKYRKDIDRFETHSGMLSHVYENTVVYNSSERYPSQPYDVVGKYTFRGYEILIVNIYPIYYIPSTGKLFYYDKVTLELEVEAGKLNPLFRGLPEDKEEVKKRVINPWVADVYDAYTSFSQDARGKSRLSSIVDPADDYKYVVITTKALKYTPGPYNFTALINSKVAQGMSATIVTVEDIVNESAYWNTTNLLFNDTMAKIRNFIRDAYLNWGTEYVLLAGDTYYVAAPPGYLASVAVGNMYGWNDILHIIYPDKESLRPGSWYYDAQSRLNTQYSSNLSMATGNNNIYVVFQHHDTTYNKEWIGIKYDNPDTQPDIEYMNNQFYLISPTTYNASDPDIAASETMILVAIMTDYHGNWDIWYLYSPDDGASWYGWYSAPYTSNDDVHPSVAISGNTAYLAYVSNNDVYLTTATIDYSGNAWTWSTPQKLNTVSGSAIAEAGCVDVSSQGVAWVDNRYGSKDIFFWSPSTGEIRVTTDDTHNEYKPKLVVDGGGNLMIGYTKEITTGDTDVMLVYSTDGGYTWNGFTVPWSGLSGLQEGPDLIYDSPTGNIYGTFADKQNIYNYIFKITDITNPASLSYLACSITGLSSCEETAITNWTRSINESGVPARSLYVDAGWGLTTYMPSDMYYACLDGNFNYDEDSKWGEPNDGPGGGDVDLMAEVYVGRAPVDNATDVANFVKKTLAYENTNDPYLKNVTMVGEYLGFGGVGDWGGNYMDELIDGSSNNNYTTIGIPSSYYNLRTLYDKNGRMEIEEIDISSYAAGYSNVAIAFVLWSDTDGIQKAGFYIDDVEITGDGSTILFDDFESGAGSWTHYASSGNDEWEIGSPTILPETYGGLPHSGNNCWGTDLDSTYDNNSYMVLQSPLLDLSSYSTVNLKFYTWYCTEYRIYPGRDYVGIHIWNGTAWNNWIWWSSGCNGWKKERMINLMNNGTHIINHLGHANYGYDLKMVISDVLSLTNDKYFFIYSQGCMAGGFDNPYGYDCIAEEFIKGVYGAFAVIMNARYGWGAAYSTDGPSHRYNREFWDAVFNESKTELGKANHDSKEDNLHRINEYCMRWCYYETNLFGDPALRIKMQPKVTTNDATNIRSHSVILNGILNDLGGMNTCNVWFVWDTVSHNNYQDYAYNTSPTAMNSPGLFSEGISGLIPNTTYYYRAIASNTIGIVVGEEKTFTTKTNNPPVASNPSPPNGATNVSITLSQLSVEITDPDGDTFDWTIETSPNIGSASGSNEANGTKTCNISGLQYGTTYTWWVNVTDPAGSGQAVSYIYAFIVNTPPHKPFSPSPANGSVNISIDPTLSVNVYDPDGDDLDVYFYNASDNSIIGIANNVPSGGVASVVWNGLEYNTTYYWYAVANDGVYTNVSDTWHFTTTVMANLPPVTSCTLSGIKGDHGWYISDVTIILNATDDSGVNATYYKLDSGVWQKYDNPFTISDSGEHILSFYSVDNLGKAEKIKIKRIKIDKTLPSTEIMAIGNESNGWYTEDVIIGFIASDSYSGVDKTIYRIDGGEWHEYKTAMLIWQEGKHVIEYYSIDRAGNAEPVKSFELKIDKYAPDVTVIYPNGGEIVNDTVNIQWNAEDMSNVTISIYYSSDNGTTWHLIATNEENDGLYEWNTDSAEDGTKYKIKIIAEDGVGHVSMDTSDKTFIVYNTFIETKIEQPKMGYLYINNREVMPLLGNMTVIIGKINIIAEINCGLPIEKVEFYIDNELKYTAYTEPYTWEWDERAFLMHEIEVVAYDCIGYTATNRVIVQVFNL